jgi:hypothetical protein
VPVAQRLSQCQQPHHAATPERSVPERLDTAVLAVVIELAFGSAEQFVRAAQQFVRADRAEQLLRQRIPWRRRRR